MKVYSLDQINQAVQDSETGGTIKPIIRLSPAEHFFGERLWIA
jgi:hypothetical protein